MTTQTRKTIAIAGASGFVGSALINQLKEKYNIIGLSRSRTGSEDGVVWRACDLFSLKEAEQGLDGADIAVYLVHSMMPSAKLTQGRFDDLDLIIADNFARAASKAKVKKIIYLGGLIPSGVLSTHLQSRLEVEQALGEQGIPCISLRAGLIVGTQGSSFEIMRKLVARLPAMICPGWTSTKSQPVSLRDTVHVIQRVIEDDAIEAGSYDIGGSDVLTYIQMMRETAKQLGKRRLFIPIFLFSPKLSRLWVTLVTGAPKELIAPLVESLRHPMVARDTRIMSRYGIKAMSFHDSLKMALSPAFQPTEKLPSSNLPVQASPSTRLPLPTALNTQPKLKSVCSVQRLPLPTGCDAAWVADHYATWLIRFLYPFVQVIRDNQGSIKFFLGRGPVKICVLDLAYSADRSSPHRQLFYIQGGALLSSKAVPKGRFEFREVLARKYVMAAIFDFVPALPWWIYKSTQALAHLVVMESFKSHLRKINAKAQNQLTSVE